jgi:hypothetical protein
MWSFASCIFRTHLSAASNAFLKNWLANLSDKVDGFKEMDLLQEHHNFWTKVVCLHTRWEVPLTQVHADHL